MDLTYILNELGEDRDQYYNAIVPPIFQTSNFLFETVDELRKAFEDEYDSFIYSRGINPTVDILRKKMAALDGAEDSLLFNSGAAAIYAAIMSSVVAGDHIVSVNKPYTSARKLIETVLPDYAITHTYVDGRRIEDFERAILPNTRLIYLESPNSLNFHLQPIAAVAELAKAEGITTIIDNSYCSPLHQQPIKLGIDMCLQSATKYIGGHSDTVAGILTGSRARMKKIFNREYMQIGSGLQPFNAWLLLRGLRTLPVRVNRISKSTRAVVKYLKEQKRVEQVVFPFDEDELAKSQMTDAFGLLNFTLVSTNIDETEKFCNSLKFIKMAVSWGGHESLIIPFCSFRKKEDFDNRNPEHRKFRLYVGLEEPTFIINDLEQAFNNI